MFAHHSMRLDELRTMTFESILYLVWIKSYSRKTIISKNEHFSSVTSGDLVFDLTEKMTEVLSYCLTALSNAAYRLSLRRSGVELHGEGHKPPRPGPLCYRWSPGPARFF